jgi:hypothetical protein
MSQSQALVSDPTTGRDSLDRVLVGAACTEAAIRAERAKAIAMNRILRDTMKSLLGGLFHPASMAVGLRPNLWLDEKKPTDDKRLSSPGSWIHVS